jgi:hypothetical protein
VDDEYRQLRRKYCEALSFIERHESTCGSARKLRLMYWMLEPDSWNDKTYEHMVEVLTNYLEKHRTYIEDKSGESLINSWRATELGPRYFHPWNVGPRGRSLSQRRYLEKLFIFLEYSATLCIGRKRSLEVLPHVLSSYNFWNSEMLSDNTWKLRDWLVWSQTFLQKRLPDDELREYLKEIGQDWKFRPFSLSVRYKNPRKV